MTNEPEMNGFFADWAELNQEDYLLFHYCFTPQGDPRAAAAGLCCEQSTAMWQRVGSDEDLRSEYGAKVVGLEKVAGVEENLWELVVAHPHRNFGPRLPNLLVAACGEGTFFAPNIETIKLTDITFSESYLSNFSGPQFGVAGLRKLLNVHGRPFFVGVVKPNLGLTRQDFAAQAFESWLGGLDIAKDDEMLADTEWSPMVERVRAVVEAKKRAESETGCKKGYIVNITDEIDRLPELYRSAVENGANMVMVNPCWTSISSIRVLRSIAQVPLVGHFAGLAVLSRKPYFGISSALLTKLMRIAGADIIIMAGYGERMRTSAEEVQANLEACLEPLCSIAPALPLPGGSSNAESVKGMAEKIGHNDFGFIAGRGVFAHPEGPRAGAKALRDAWKS